MDKLIFSTDKVKKIYLDLDGHEQRLINFLEKHPNCTLKITESEFCKLGYSVIFTQSMQTTTFSIARDGNCGICLISHLSVGGYIESTTKFKETVRELLDNLMKQRVYIYTGNQQHFKRNAKPLGFVEVGRYINPNNAAFKDYRVVAVLDNINPSFYESNE